MNASMRSQFILGRPKRGLSFLSSPTVKRLVVIVVVIIFGKGSAMKRDNITRKI